MALYDIRNVSLNFQLSKGTNTGRPIADENLRSIRAIHKKRKSEKEKANIHNRMIASVLSKVEVKTNRKDNDISNMQGLPWNDSTHVQHGTIPGSLSIRAPPSTIGGRNERKDKFIGITNLDASRRYMSQLQKDRERNNKAVHQVLDNLPIKIRQVTHDAASLDPGTHLAKHSGINRVQQEEVIYPEHLEHVPPTYENRLSAINSCFHPLVGCKICKKCSRLRKKRERKTMELKREITSPLGTYRSDRSTRSGRDACYSYDSAILRLLGKNTSHINNVGFQGHPVRSKNPIKGVRKKIQAFGHSIQDEENTFRKDNQGMATRKNYLLVTSSLVTGQKVGNIRMKQHKKLPPINTYENTKENMRVFTIPSVKRNDNSLSNTLENHGFYVSPRPFPIVPMHSFASDISIPNVGKEDSSTSSSHELSTETTEDILLNKINSPASDKPDVNNLIPYSKTPIVIPIAGEDSFGIDHQETTHSSQIDNDVDSLTDISEQDESSIGKTERNEPAQEVRLSVRIQFRHKDHESVRKNSKSLETVTVPRWIDDKHRNSTGNSKPSLNSNVETLGNKFNELRTDGVTRHTHNTGDPTVLQSQESTFTGSESAIQTAFVQKHKTDIPFEENEENYKDIIDGSDQTRHTLHSQLMLSASNLLKEEITYNDNIFRSNTKDTGDIQYIARNMSKEQTRENIVKTIEDAEDLAFTEHLNSF